MTTLIITAIWGLLSGCTYYWARHIIRKRREEVRNYDWDWADVIITFFVSAIFPLVTILFLFIPNDPPGWL